MLVESDPWSAYNRGALDGLHGKHKCYIRSDFGTPGGATEVPGMRSMTNNVFRQDRLRTAIRGWSLLVAALVAEIEACAAAGAEGDPRKPMLRRK